MVKECPVVGACEDGFDFLRISDGFFHRPLWKEAGVDHEVRPFAVVEGPMPEPRQEVISIGRGQYVVQRVLGPQRKNSFRHREQKEVVVAKNDLSG